MDKQTEFELIQKARSDPAAFGVLYEHHYIPVFGYIFRRVIDRNLAQDIASEVFLKAYTNFWKYRWTGVSIGAWFYRIATNEVNIYFRNKKYEPMLLSPLHENKDIEHADTSTTEDEKERLDHELKTYEDFLIIRSRLTDLSVKYQEVIALRYFEQKSIKEIAEILNKKEGTIKSLLSRAIDKMKDLL
jgi:RNA polymerase sigma-70 factor (ECF subfamily)